MSYKRYAAWFKWDAVQINKRTPWPLWPKLGFFFQNWVHSTEVALELLSLAVQGGLLLCFLVDRLFGLLDVGFPINFEALCKEPWVCAQADLKVETVDIGGSFQEAIWSAVGNMMISIGKTTWRP